MAEQKPETVIESAEAAPPVDALADATAFLESSSEEPQAEATEAASTLEAQKPAEPAKPAEVEPAKPDEQLSPQMQAIARREKRLLDERTAIKAEREAFEKERQEWQSSKGSLDEFQRLARTDIAALAEKLQLTADQRKELATELWYSGEPEDKRPKEFRQQAKQRTEAEVLKERLEKLERERAEERKSLEQERQRVEAERAREGFLGHVTKAVDPAKAPLVADFLEVDEQGVKADLWHLAMQMQEADPESDIDPSALVGRYEAILAGKFGKLRSKWSPSGTSTKSGSPVETERKASPTTLSNQRTATQTKGRTEPQTDDERLLEAARFLESR